MSKDKTKFEDYNKDQVSLDIGIREYKLKEEWLKQPQIIWEYSSMVAEKRKEKDLIARRVKVKHAKLNINIRENPDKYFPEKVLNKASRLTEGLIESVIELNEDYERLSQRQIQLEYEYQMLKNIVDALSDKRKSLEGIQELYMSSLYAAPREKTEQQIREKINKRKC